jgi:sugar O-acyltransferase (sialic acid O-acetyltransferase NeuD family)
MDPPITSKRMGPKGTPERSAIGILGAGRQAIETAGYCREVGLQPVFYVEEIPPSESRDAAHYAAPILSFHEVEDDLLKTPVVSAVGAPAVRRRLVDRWHGAEFMQIVSPHAWIATDAVIGIGTTIAPMAALNRLVHVGAHVLVNVGAILSHDVTVEDFVTISPGCAVGGCVSIGSGTFLGIGATIRDRVAIGRGCVVAAGAVVVRDVPDGDVVRGVPAQSGRER